MSTPNKLKRFLLILERTRTQPSFAELKDHLEQHGFSLSARTLQRDIEQIRAELGLEISYDRPNNRYRGPKEDGDRAALLPLLERAVLGVALGADGNTIRTTAPYVRMEHKGRLLGLHHWDALLGAVRDRHECLVTYRHAMAVPDQVFRLRPCVLKEYRGQWFVLATAEGYAHPIGLGLDHIQHVEVTGTRFAVRERVHVELFYDPIIGMDSSAAAAVPITLWFPSIQGQYVKALPIHHSQQVLREDASGVVVTLFVLPNFELKRELLGFGARVRVLEPLWLAQEIRNEHLAAAG